MDEESAELSKNIDLAASHSLKKKKQENKKKQVNQIWFDFNLKKMRTHLFNDGKMFSKYQKRSLYYKLQREYNKTRKQTYREYKNSLLNQLETLHSDNPNIYWNFINELKESKSCGEMSSAVDSSAWVSHFRNLSEIDDKFTERLNELKQTLSKLENSTNFNELDFSIKESEISRTLAKFKLTKSTGLDNISNNMLKMDNLFYYQVLKNM